MRIVVCIKQVPGHGEVRLDPVTHTIIREATQAITNPFDAFAIELAVQIMERLPPGGAETVALSMGIPATEGLLRDAVARGLDRSVLLCDRAFAGADTLATSYTLAKGIEKLGGADLILCGRMATDGDTAQIGPELAEHLGIPHVTEVLELLSLHSGEVTVIRRLDGVRQELAVTLPAVLCVCKDINAPRMPSLRGIRKSAEAWHHTWDRAALAADPARCGLNGSPTQVVETFLPDRDAQGIELRGDEAAQAEAIAAIIREVGACRS